MKPRLLDLFCGAGGAARGYQLAGFYVVGVDIRDQPHYAGDEFIQANAMEYPTDGFDVIHASPPCQAHTTMSNRWRGFGGGADAHLNFIPETRAWIGHIGIPYVIENVPGAKRFLHSPITLSGGMFGLEVERPRLFESSEFLFMPPSIKVADPIGVYGKAHDGRRLFTRADGSQQRAAASLQEGQTAMGIDWMDWRELAEAIPPAYTEWIGRQLLTAIRRAVA
jgi:hypothetical protein